MDKKFIQRPGLKVNLLGQLLIERGLIDGKQLSEALDVQRASGGFLGDVLIKLGFINEEALSVTFANQFEACFLPLERYKIPENIFKLIPGELARRLVSVPLEKIDNVLIIATAMPLEKNALGEIELSAGARVICVYAARSRIVKIINDVYPLLI